MRKRLFKAAQLLLFLLIAASLLYLAFRNVDFDEFLQHFMEIDIWWYLAFILVSWLSFVFRALRWRILIQAVNTEISRIHCYHSVIIGYLANFLFPRLGELLRCVSVSRFSGAPLDKMVGTVVGERCADLVTMLLLMLLLLVLKKELLESFLSSAGISLSPSGIAFATIGIVIVLVLVMRLCYLIAHRRQNKSHMAAKLVCIVDGVWDGLTSIWKMKKKGLFLVHTVGLWGSYFLTTYFLFFAFEFTSHLGLRDGLYTLVLSSLAILVPAQGGFGSFHLAIMLGFGLLGIKKTEALVYATTSHETMLLLVLLCGIVAVAALMLNQRRKSSAE